MNRDNIEFYQSEFPRTFNDFVYLAREFTKEEISRCDKDGLIELCVELKRKELQYYIERNEIQNQLDKIAYDIESLSWDDIENGNYDDIQFLKNDVKDILNKNET